MSKRKAPDRDNCDSGTPSKVKKNKQNQKYRTEYEKTFPGILASEKGENFVYCYLCDCDIKIASRGRPDITKHYHDCESEKHSENMPRWEDFQRSKKKKITDMFQAQLTKDRSAIEAVVTWVNFLLVATLTTLALVSKAKLPPIWLRSLDTALVSVA